MSESFAALAGGLSLAGWALSYLWIRRGGEGADVLTRFGKTLVLPIMGVGAASVILHGVDAWPWLLMLGGAGALDVLALRRLRVIDRSLGV